jgi:hypothetical protein
MPDAWNSAKIREFEYVLALPSVALLRVSAKPSRRRPTAGPRPVLVAKDGQTTRRFAATPAPPDDRGVLRAAYAVGSDLLAPDITFSLELADRSLLALPTPRRGAARLAPKSGVDSPNAPGDDPELPIGADERRSGLVAKLTELSARLAESEQARQELERSVAPLSDASERLGNELLGARERAARAETEAKQSAAAREELDTWRGELERRITETTDQLSAATIARTQGDAELVRLGGELAEAEANIELLQAQVTTLTDERAEAEARADAASIDPSPAAVPYSPSETEEIADQAGHLAALLESLAELANVLAGARSQAQNLHAAARAEPRPHPASPTATETPLVVAHAEIVDPREEPAQAGDVEGPARVEAGRDAGEAEARELAERELAEADSANL